jgi:hypothetical protein
MFAVYIEIFKLDFPKVGFFDIRRFRLARQSRYVTMLHGRIFPVKKIAFKCLAFFPPLLF